MTWKQRYNRMKKHYKWTNADVALITGHAPTTVTQLINSKQQEFPRWLRLAIVIFETEQQLEP
ncbi:hypothetical protein GCM10027592_29310 [Spirosoma flavus]